MKPYIFIKQTLDFFLSILGVILLWPIFLIIGIAIKLNSKGPVFFKQRRIGKNKKEFHILKFRTMLTDTPNDMPTHLLEDPEVFITKVGRVLRKTSLDELPQIINIIKGDMSVVGPRPALWNQLDLIEERDKNKANSVKPGLTGWAQINGRDELVIKDKAKLDGEYIILMSFWFDIKCMILTFVSVIKHNGVIEGGTGRVFQEKVMPTNEETIAE